MSFCSDLIWPMLDRLTPDELVELETAELADVTELEESKYGADIGTALAEAHRIESDEDERKKTAEAKASNVLLVLGALIPLLTYLETSIWDSKLGTAPKWITLFLLVSAVAYWAGAAVWAFKAISVSAYHRIGAVEIARIFANGETSTEGLVRQVLIYARRNQDKVNRKVSAVKMTHAFMLRGLLVLSCLLLVQASFEIAHVFGFWNIQTGASSAPTGPVGPRGEKGEPGAAGMQLREVRQSCAKGMNCAVSCEDGEVALNAFCQRSVAKLVGEREVNCGNRYAQEMIAFCGKK